MAWWNPFTWFSSSGGATGLGEGGTPEGVDGGRWDVQFACEDGAIIAIRPEGFKDWGTGDDDGEKLAILYGISIEATYGMTYRELNEFARDQGGDGLTKTGKQIAAAETAAFLAREAPAEAAGALSIADIEAEVIKRGYKPLVQAQAVIEEVLEP